VCIHIDDDRVLAHRSPYHGGTTCASPSLHGTVVGEKRRRSGVGNVGNIGNINNNNKSRARATRTKGHVVVGCDGLDGFGTIRIGRRISDEIIGDDDDDDDDGLDDRRTRSRGIIVGHHIPMDDVDRTRTESTATTRTRTRTRTSLISSLLSVSNMVGSIARTTTSHGKTTENTHHGKQGVLWDWCIG